jgi:nitrite reductase/ring-hydroxylating ferredoxin subunit
MPPAIRLSELEDIPLAFPTTDFLSGSRAYALRVAEQITGAIDLSTVPGQSGFAIGFSGVCTHMGCRLPETVLPDGGDTPDGLVVGPCPCHGTSFDLERSGLVVLGPATQHLPLLRLGLDGDSLEALNWLTDVDPVAERWPGPLASLSEDTGAAADALLAVFNDGNLDDLQNLSGLGTALAERVIAARPFASLSSVTRVQGIGPSSLRTIIKQNGEELG